MNRFITYWLSRKRWVWILALDIVVWTAILGWNTDVGLKIREVLVQWNWLTWLVGITSIMIALTAKAVLLRKYGGHLPPAQLWKKADKEVEQILRSS